MDEQLLALIKLTIKLILQQLHLQNINSPLTLHLIMILLFLLLIQPRAIKPYRAINPSLLYISLRVRHLADREVQGIHPYGNAKEV